MANFTQTQIEINETIGDRPQIIIGNTSKCTSKSKWGQTRLNP
jgi:hypothetical protein